MERELIARKLDRFSAWYRLTQSWGVLQVTAFLIAAGLAVYVLLDKLLFVDLSYHSVAYLVTLFGLLGLGIYFLFSKKHLDYVSYLVDRSAGYKNLIASGLHAPGEDEASQAVMQRAHEALDGSKPHELIPFRMNWAGKWLVVPLVLLGTAFVIPHYDLLGRQQASLLKAAEEEAVAEGALKLKQKITLIDKTPQNLGEIEGKELTSDFTQLAEDLNDISTKDAMMKLGEFENKYRDEFAKYNDFEKMARDLKASPDMTGLDEKSQKALKDAIDDLKNGDMKSAAEAMRDMAEQLQSADLSEEEKKALAREMKKVAENMSPKGAESELAKALSELESSPEDLAQKMKEAADAMQDMANDCEACQGMQAMKDGLKEAKESMTGGEFADLDAKKIEEWMNGEATLGQGQGGQGQGEGQQPGQQPGQGGGTGGEGQGKGGLPLENFTETAFKKEMSNQKMNKGRVLNEIFVTGVPEKGEARVEYVNAVRAAKQDATGYLARDNIPRESEEMVKRYFDSLDQQPDAAAPAPQE